MTKYILKRILLMIFVLFVITTMEFVLVRMLPRVRPPIRCRRPLLRPVGKRWAITSL